MMTININHPTFKNFLDNVTNLILSNISVEKYFSLSVEKKLNIQYIVLKLIKSSLKNNIDSNTSDLKNFINILCKKNDDLENYEFSEILKDISNNFDTINENLKTNNKPLKSKKTQ